MYAFPTLLNILIDSKSAVFKVCRFSLILKIPFLHCKDDATAYVVPCVVDNLIPIHW